MEKKFKPYVKATTTKKDGVISWKWDEGEEKKFKNYLNSLQFKEATAKIKLTVERYRNDASTQQFRYLWGVVYPILGDYFGYDAYEYDEFMHRPLKAMFLGYKRVEQRSVYKIFKEPIKTVNATVVELISITELDTKEMTEFIENIRRWALKEYNVYIPAPNEVDYNDLPDTLPEF